MPDMEALEMAKQRGQLDHDVEALVKRYVKIMGWDVPDVDLARARALVLDEIKQAVARIERR
jgi:hypothetical protein